MYSFHKVTATEQYVSQLAAGIGYGDNPVTHLSTFSAVLLIRLTFPALAFDYFSPCFNCITLPAWRVVQVP